MPNRILYASLLNSNKVNQLKSQEFELYIRLILVADDFGRYSGNPVRIARSCWPDSESISGKTITPWLESLIAVGLIDAYKVGNDNLIQLTNWNQRTRQKVSKYPSPDEANQSNDGQVTVTCQSDACHMLTETETETETYICTEQTSLSAPVVNLPLNDGTEFGVDQEQVDKWKELYPAVDVLSELRKMIGWLDANPKKRKTKQGITRFANNWLARQQDKPQTGGGSVVNQYKCAD